LPAGLSAETDESVDAGNYYPRQRDGRIEAIEGGLQARPGASPSPLQVTTVQPRASCCGSSTSVSHRNRS
jgi:hypothetical protein